MIKPADYEWACRIVEKFFTDNDYQYQRFGVETLPLSLQAITNLIAYPTALYVRTRPDYIARQGTWDAVLVEVKAPTEEVKRTGNYAVEAFPWFIARHLSKLGINYYYATPDPDAGLRFYRPSDQPFSGLNTVIFRERDSQTYKTALTRLHSIFKDVKPKYMKDGNGSNDPFLLIPREFLKHAQTKPYGLIPS